MNYDEYTHDEHVLYESFAQTVASIIEAAIADSGQDFRVQQISFRAKSNTSLHRKLTERNLLESSAIEAELKDLAGCRIVFYTNPDTDRFLNSRLIFGNFQVDFDGSKIHHAVGTDRATGDLYFAIHYLVSLTDERLVLPEYRKFRGLRCEIQLQTILNHAWAETTHDILYHRPNIEGFGTRQYAAIEGRLRKIMNKYLIPAGYEFQRVQYDFERLRQGKELFDRNTVEALKTAEDNNDRYEHLQRVKNDLLPFYDDVPAVAPVIIRNTVEAIKKARTTATKEIETPLGNLRGHTAEQVVNAGLEIIEALRYVDVQETFRVLCDLYVSAANDEERRRIIQAAERLAVSDLDVWQQAGFIVQKRLQESITALNDDELAAARSVVLAVARQILDPELSGSTWHFESVSIHRGAVPVSDEFDVVRRNVIDFLFRMYEQASSEWEKRGVIQALNQAMRFPASAPYGDALANMVLDDTRRIVEFFVDRAEAEQFEIVQALEHDLLWLYRRAKDQAGAQSGVHAAEIAGKAREVLTAIERFRSRANSRERFVRFKTLVGYESVFPPEWEGDPMNVGEPQAYRSGRIAEYVASVTDETANEWYEVIEQCAAVRSNDMATFPSFAEFLKQLASRCPDIVLAYLKRGDALTGFLPAVLAGLAASSEPSIATDVMQEWTARGQHLAASARHLRLTKGASEDLLRKVGEKALTLREPVAIIEAIAAIAANDAVTLVDPIVVVGMQYLTSIKDSRWVAGVWFMPEFVAFISKLSQLQCEVLLDNLLFCRRMRHAEDRILGAIGERFPESIWLFLKQRLDRDTQEKVVSPYEAIPRGLGDFRVPLARNPAFAVKTVREWYMQDNRLFEFRGGQVLHDVFPGIGSEIEAPLLSVVREGTDDAIGFVLRILRTYQGEPFVHGLCEAIIDAVPEGDRRLGEVEIILQSTGVVAGQFGFVEAYQRKKEEVAPWLADERPKVHAFAERYIRTLDRSIAAEQRRSEADYEMRRREWPEEGK
jgi:ppGpp synthetase/RelA/SpoT-type nucleotidyltranferase